MSTCPLAPARRVLEAAERANLRLGHENRGFLSAQHGFLPLQPPLDHLPPSHAAWDALAGDLPDLLRTLTVRAALDTLPALPADAARLPPRYLCRAASLLAIFAHAYVRSQPEPPAALPLGVRQPWGEVTRRLSRPTPVLSYIDLIVYNWRLRDPRRPDLRHLENLELLVPTVDNQAERVFYLAQVEMLAQTTPLLTAVVGAQEAVLHADRAGLAGELLRITAALEAITAAFRAIDPHPHSPTYVDPVLWAKTVGPFAGPLTPGAVGASGAACPLFHLMDAFLHRTQYRSRVGQESLHIRAEFPPHWRGFLAAVAQISIRQFVAATGDPALEELWRGVVAAYVGEQGLLGVHRRKVYGFLQIAFKMGHSVTTGGFSGMFHDPGWDQVDAELAVTLRERDDAGIGGCPFAHVRAAGPPAGRGAQHVVLDVAGAGLRYRPGDRCGILPANSPLLVRRTLRALRAGAREPVALDPAWRAALAVRGRPPSPAVLPLAALLTYGQIRPVRRPVAVALADLSGSPTLRAILATRAEEEWELWDLLERLTAEGWDPRRLWPRGPGAASLLCTIVPPESFRLYSIASAPDDEPGGGTREVHLTVGAVSYAPPGAGGGPEMPREGTASSFLRRAGTAATSPRVPVQVVHPARFHLPADPTRPIVMFAGGTGIAPFRGFWQERARGAAGGENWLFFSTRTRAQVYYQEEIAALAAAGRLHVRLACTGRAAAPAPPAPAAGVAPPGLPSARAHVDQVMLAGENARLLWDLLRSREEGGRGAYFYVCGPPGFARTVQAGLQALLRRFAPDVATARTALYRLHGEGRYMQDVFTPGGTRPAHPAPGYRVSEIVQHNDAAHGYWIVLHELVYDVSEFIHLHPGGAAVLRDYAGRDATAAYQAVRHHCQAEVDALRGLYALGPRAPVPVAGTPAGGAGARPPAAPAVAALFGAWTAVLDEIVAMQNALALDWQVLDAPPTGVAPSGDLSPLQGQLLAEAHARFLGSYFADLLESALPELWRRTRALCVPAEEPAEIPGPWPPGAARTLDYLRPPRAPAGAAARWRRVAALDRRVLADIKEIVRAGVQVCETGLVDPPTRGGGTLLATLEQLGPAVERFCAGLALCGAGPLVARPLAGPAPLAPRESGSRGGRGAG